MIRLKLDPVSRKLSINARCEILPVSLETLQSAVKLRDQYLLSFWDSLIVASAVLGDASILYSEDK